MPKAPIRIIEIAELLGVSHQRATNSHDRESDTHGSRRASGC
jgi:hypothetical protein